MGLEEGEVMHSGRGKVQSTHGGGRQMTDAIWLGS